MINIQTMPKETLVELLLYLADNEPFDSVSNKLGGAVTVEEVRAVLRELAMGLSKEAAEGQAIEIDEARKSKELSKKARDIISFLSPQEERALLTAFGLIGGDAQKAHQ